MLKIRTSQMVKISRKKPLFLSSGQLKKHTGILKAQD